MQLYNQEQEEINKILMNLSQAVANHAAFFIDSYNKLLDIDKYIARAKLAIRMDAVMPKVNDELKFNLIKARHPLIEKSKVVPTDISLGFDYDTMIMLHYTHYDRLSIFCYHKVYANQVKAYTLICYTSLCIIFINESISLATSNQKLYVFRTQFSLGAVYFLWR